MLIVKMNCRHLMKGKNLPNNKKAVIIKKIEMNVLLIKDVYK